MTVNHILTNAYSFFLFLAILLGSFKVGYEEIRDAIYRCDDAIITENVLANFIKLLPTNEQVYIFSFSYFFRSRIELIIYFEICC